MAAGNRRTDSDTRWYQRRSCTKLDSKTFWTIGADDYRSWKSRILQLINLVDLIDFEGQNSDVLRQHIAAILLETLSGSNAVSLRRHLLQIIVDVLRDPAAADLRQSLAKALTELLAEDMVEIVRGVLDALGIKKPRTRRKASKPSEGKDALYGQE